LPLSILFPAFGVGVAGLDLLGAANINYRVFTNPRSTLGQKGIAVLLFVAAAYGGRASINSFRANGWMNTAAFRSAPRTTVPLTQASTLAEMLTGLPDDAMIHLSPSDPSTLAAGVTMGYWVRFGDVKHLNLAQFKIGVIGDLAAGGQKSATTFAIKMPASENAMIFDSRGAKNFAGVEEFVSKTPVQPDPITVVEQNP
jgi:hypothetical protein